MVWVVIILKPRCRETEAPIVHRLEKILNLSQNEQLLKFIFVLIDMVVALMLLHLFIAWTSRRIVVSDGRDWTRQSDWTGLLFFVSAVLLFTIILLFLLPSAVSLSYFNLAVPMRKCLGKHSCMSSTFSIAILNGTCSLRVPILFCGDVPDLNQLNYKLQTNLLLDPGIE